MPNQTIDLSRDCEAWYDFDTDYFDSNRGVIQDRSGHGRHAKASGGPTVGVEGPDSFGGARLDGTDDYFSIGEAGQLSQMTATILFKNNDVNTNELTGLLTYDKFNHRINLGENANIIWKGDSNDRVNYSAAEYNEWILLTIRFDSTIPQSTLFIGDEEQGNVSYNNQSDPQGIFTKLGYANWRNNYSKIDVAMYAYWSRALSDAEIEYLNRLTAPRRSRL